MNIFGLSEQKNKIDENKPKAKTELIKELDNLLKLSQLDFARYQIEADPISGRISDEDKEEIVNASIACGNEEAEILLESYPDCSVQKLANRLGLKIHSKDNQSTLDYIYFGMFESPNNIFIFNENINKAQDLLRDYNIEISKVKFEDIIMAHEIFHFIEDNKPYLYSNTKRIDLWSIGDLYTHSSKLICPGEIAGMSFAKRLLSLDFDPNILDYIFSATFNSEEATRLYIKMIKSSKN